VRGAEPYEEILRLTQEQAEAIRNSDLERLLSLLVQRGEMMASLPMEPDGVWERAQRQRIAELDISYEASLLARREQVLTELDELRRGRTGLGGYRTDVTVETACIDRTC
jgi:hypothetical protein